MIKSMFAIGALTLAVAAPAAAQMAAGGTMPRCSATVRDSCDQGANNPAAMTADQAMATGGVGDRKSDNAGRAMASNKPMMHKHKMMHHKMMMKHTMKSSTDATPDAAAKPM